MSEETHDELVKRAGQWLKSFGCSVALMELVASTTSGEIPDAIGWKGGHSVLIECKTNRSDFLSDKRKRFRRFPDTGMGCYRLYLCPPDVIKVKDLPDGWGLLYTNGKRIKRIVAPKGNYFPHDGDVKPFYDRSLLNEVSMLVSALRRKDQWMKDRMITTPENADFDQQFEQRLHEIEIFDGLILDDAR